MRVVRFIVIFVAIVGLGAAALAGSFALLVPAGAEYAKTTSYGPLLPKMNKQALRSYVFDSRGGVMSTLFEEDREPIPLEEVPDHLIHAVLAIEDRRFYEHDGVDYEGTVRALFQNLDAGEIQQGGSTITQQLVKNTMGDPLKRDLKTKIREAVLAVRLENEMSKHDILERYLNVVYFGNGAYGVKSAAERYFAKRDPMQLTLGESALLAGLIQSPATLDPITHPDQAARRRTAVLDAMVETHAITAEQARVAREEPLPTTAKSPDRRRELYTQYVVDQLVKGDDKIAGDPAEYLGPTEDVRYNALFRGGLRIYTSYDPLMQWLVRDAVKTTIPDSDFVAAVAVIDNATGAVRAMYPGKDFQDDEYNPVAQTGRQTGSAFKAIVAATALEAGYSPQDTVSGGKLVWRMPPGQEAWAPRNCRGGTMTLEHALSASNNCAYARTLLSLGPGNWGKDGATRVKDMARRLGIDATKLDEYPSLALGASSVNMLDMAEAFSVFANEGIHRSPIFVSKIVDADGKVIYEADTAGQRVFDEQVARSETEMLSGVIGEGTGTRAQIDRPAAGKTGTSNENRDAWFVGYTPQFTTAVWMGHWKAEVPMTNVGGIKVQGGTYPARIWKAFMTSAHQGLPVLNFNPPDEDAWPSSEHVDEFGRDADRSSRRRSNDSERAPTDTAPEAPETVPAAKPVVAPG